MNVNKIAAYLDRKTILVTGATGFLGQPLVEKILWSSPGVQRVYVLIRPKRQSAGVVLSAQQRLEKELYESSVFDRIRTAYGSEWLAFLREKLIAVAGDIGQEGLGIEPETRAMLQRDLDVVINSAAVVSFDAPLDRGAGSQRAWRAARGGVRGELRPHDAGARLDRLRRRGLAPHRHRDDLSHRPRVAPRRDFPARLFQRPRGRSGPHAKASSRACAARRKAPKSNAASRALVERARAGRGGQALPAGARPSTACAASGSRTD